MEYSKYFGVFTAILSASLVKGLAAAPRPTHSFDYLQLQDKGNATTNATTTADCFNKYLPMLTEIGSTYSTQYQVCISLSKEAIQTLVGNATITRNKFMATSADISETFEKCNSHDDILGFFDCYASVADSDISILNNLQTNASSNAVTMAAGLLTIRNERDQCLNTTQSTYVENTIETYDLMNACLKTANGKNEGPIDFPPNNVATIQNANTQAEVVPKNNSEGINSSSNSNASGSNSQNQNQEQA